MIVSFFAFERKREWMACIFLVVYIDKKRKKRVKTIVYLDVYQRANIHFIA